MTTDVLDLELYYREPIAYVGPRIRDDYSPRLRAALERRRDAVLDGRCACGGGLAGGGPLAPGIGEASIEHQTTCDAIDDVVAALLDAETRP